MLVLFIVLQLVNVILNTIKSIITIKGTKFMASIVSAITYGVYTIVVFYTASDDLSLFDKVWITMATNVIGVYVSMLLLEKTKKDRLWEITATITSKSNKDIEYIAYMLDFYEISHNYLFLNNGQGAVFHIYSKTQKESEQIKNLLDKYNAKYIVHEEQVRL